MPIFQNQNYFIYLFFFLRLKDESELQVGAASREEGVGGLLWPAQDDLTVSARQSDRPQSILEVDLQKVCIISQNLGSRASRFFC
jgi:hypothetical protein